MRVLGLVGGFSLGSEQVQCCRFGTTTKAFATPLSCTLSEYRYSHSLKALGSGLGYGLASQWRTPVFGLEGLQKGKTVMPRLKRRVTETITGRTITAAAAADADGTECTLSSDPQSDTRLGSLFLNLLPGCLLYVPAFVMPLMTLGAAVGASWGPAFLQTVAGLPMVQHIGSLSNYLAVAGTQQPWLNLTSLTFSLLAAWYAFIGMPVLDSILGREFRNPSHEEEEAPEGVYRFILYTYVFLHFLVLGLACHLVCSYGAPPIAIIGTGVSCGVANGIGFTVAHELLHSPHRVDRWLSAILLIPTGYMFWTKAHLAHHVKVATLEDSGSARLGESLYSFIPRAITGNIVSGFTMAEKERRKKRKAILSFGNIWLWWIILPILSTLFVGHAWGIRGLLFYIVQAIVGVIMLEIVNYIEHYGLKRSKLANGRYEKVQPCHSWNATTLWTNSAAFKLQRHADHHAFERRPYHLLRDIQEAPQLPYGYPTMMLLAAFPPAWFHIMDPLAMEVESCKSQH